MKLPSQKTIGLLGGMSWESTASYYRLINEEIKHRLGGLHSAKILMHSFDFAEIEKLQADGEWAHAGQILAKAASNLEKAGAEFIVLCTNTMHKEADQIAAYISVPFLHIADATAARIKQQNMTSVALLGTRFTMEQAFYKKRLHEQYGIEVLTPNAADRKIIHDIIYDELCLGTIEDSSRAEYVRIIQQLHYQGAEAVICGCTEIPLLVTPQDTEVPLLDTTKIHAKAAVELALQDT